MMNDNDLWTYREDIWVVTPATGETNENLRTSNTRTGVGMTTDLPGYTVEARDGSIGKIDDATNETNRACLVVDTGPWIFGRKVMIPAGTIERIDRDNDRVFVNLTKDQIKNSPEFDPNRLHDDEYRTQLGDYYTRSGWTRAA
jgi:hypothetical protein